MRVQGRGIPGKQKLPNNRKNRSQHAEFTKGKISTSKKSLSQNPPNAKAEACRISGAKGSL